MTEPFPFSTKDMLYIASFAIPYLLCVFSPVIYSCFVALRHKPSLPRKKLFIVTITSITYGFFIFIYLAFSIPVEFYLNSIAPSIRHSGHYYGQPFVAIADFIITYGWLIIGFLLLCTAIVLTQYLRKRWAAVVNAIRV
jgi:hypothetical protein